MCQGPAVSRSAAAELLPRHRSREMVAEEEFGVPFGRGCALPIGKQSNILIKATVKKQERPGRQIEKTSECCGLRLVLTCLKAFHKCVVQRWG